MLSATVGRAILIGHVQFHFQKEREGEGAWEDAVARTGTRPDRLLGTPGTPSQLRAERHGTGNAIGVRGDLQHGTSAAAQ